MAIVACYNIKSLVVDGSAVSIDRVYLNKGQSSGIVYRSPAVDAAVSKGLVSIATTAAGTASAPAILTEYINTLNGRTPTVYPLPVGAL